MKKILAGVLAFCLVAGVMPSNTVKFVDNSITANAEDEYTKGTYESLTYQKYSDHVIISGCDKSVEIVNIPDEIEGLPVTEIGNKAFLECSSLTEITIPKSITKIGACAFAFCEALQDVTILNADCDIHDWVDFGLYDSGIFYNGFYNESLSPVLHGYDFSTVQAYAKKYGLDFESLGESPEKATGTISGFCGAEGNEDNVTWTLDKGTGVLTISGTGEMADYDGRDSKAPWQSIYLREVIIESGITNIGDYNFHDCYYLESISIPNSVVSIDDYAFAYCFSLSSITIPDSIMSIGESTFSGCSSLIDITIPNSITLIGWYTFANCSSLTEITIPDNVTSIEGCAFENCSSLAEITIPNNITEIGPSAFENCSSLTEIIIPDSVTEIGDSTFSGCSNLIEITIPNSVTKIGQLVFSGCTSLSSIDVTKNNEYYSSIDGVLFDKNKTEVIQYPKGNKNTTYIIPDSVNIIGSKAFSNCKSLESVTIPDSVTKIDYYAFSMCESLKSVTILNPDCEIGDLLQIISNGYDDNSNDYYNGVIRGYENSTAQKYAEENGYKFEVLGEVSDSTTVPTNPEITLWGDVNLDEDVNISDAVLIMQSIANPDEFNVEEQGKLNGDVVDNGNGLTNVDALAIQYVEIKTITPDAFPMTSTELDTLSK